MLGETVEEIAQEKLAVAHDGSIVVLPDNIYVDLVSGHDDPRSAARAPRRRRSSVTPSLPSPVIRLPGRLERRRAEIRDGAHNPAGARWLAEQLRPERYVLVVSVLRDKDVDAMLSELAVLGDTLVATTSSNPRALPARELASRAARHFDHVEAVEAPRAAVARAHELGEPVLVTGSLYLLADLEST